MKLTGQVAIVTGGGSGQGRATALLFAQEGAKVVIGDVNASGAEETVRLINRQEGGQATAIKVDVTKADEVRGLVDAAVSRYGRLDILINNAGATLFKGIEETTEEDWNRILDTNLKGVFLGCKFAIPAMRQSGGGSIVNIASVAGLLGMPQHFAYCAAKAGVDQLTRCMANELKDYNIRVNVVYPGITETHMQELIRASDDQQMGGSAEFFRKRYERGENLPPELPARLIVWLSRQSDLNGQILDINDPDIRQRAGL